MPSAPVPAQPKRGRYFLWTSLLFLVITSTAIIAPTLLTGSIATAGKFFYSKFDWLVMWLPLLVLLFCLSVALPARFGNIRLGGPDTEPEFSFGSWMSMLFTSGIGVGVIFFGPLEGVWAYFQSPLGQQATHLPLYEQFGNSMSLALHIWGIPAWSLYTVVGLVMAYFSYQHKTECTPAAPLLFAFRKKRWARPLGVFVTSVAIISIGISVSSSIAMAAEQITAGLTVIFGPIGFDRIGWKAGVLGMLAAGYTLGAVLPIGKGMKRLGNLTIAVALALMLFVLLAGPTHYFLSTLSLTVGNIITQTVKHSFQLYMFRDRDWVIWFPMVYWVWWITWAPFVGVFLARISRGRTLREFVLASILVPTGFIVVWFSLFSGFALLDTIEGSQHLAGVANGKEYEGTIYHVLNMLPISDFTKPLTILLFLGFIITTVISAAISLGIMTSSDGRHENRFRAAVWCVFMTLIAYAVVFTGKIEGIKAVGSFAGFPFVFIMYLWMAALWRQLRCDTALPGQTTGGTP